MGVIFGFSSQPQSVLNLGQPAFVGKLAHVTEYLILGWLIQRALGGRSARRSGWQAWLIALAYAVTDEFHQTFVPGRTPLLTDVMIDSAGTAIGIVIAVWRERARFDL
jgi:VanZ family protein